MVREKGERAALDKIAEMADCSMCRQKFSVEGGILGFGGGKGAGKKGVVREGRAFNMAWKGQGGWTRETRH